MKFIFYCILIFTSNICIAQTNSLLPSLFRLSYSVSIDTSNKNDFNSVIDFTKDGIKSVIIKNAILSDCRKFEAFEYISDHSGTISSFKYNYPYNMIKGVGVPYSEDDMESIFLNNNKTIKDSIIKSFIELLFIEDWNFDEKKFVFKKDIIAYIPIKLYFSQKLLKSLKTIIFAISTDEVADDYVKIANLNYKFTFPICNDTNYIKIPSLSNYAKLNLTQSILNKIKVNEIQAFDYRTGNKLTYENIIYSRRCDEFVDSINKKISLINFFDNTDMSCWEYYTFPLLYNSFIFNEDLYYSKKTLNMKKVVKSICFLRYYPDVAIPHFIVYFNEN